MKTMTTVPFTFRMEKDLKESLTIEAKENKRSSSYLASKAIKMMLDLRKEKKQAVLQAIKEADKGIFISQNAVHKWMDSWDTKNELEKPKADIFLKN